MAQAHVHPPSIPSPAMRQPVDEYARDNELTIDFQSYNPVSCLTSTANSVPLQSHCLGQGEDDSLPKLHIPFRLSLHEPPVISKASVNFLNSIAQREDDEVVMSRAIQASCSNQMRYLKVELPLLRSDHESDLRKLQRDMTSKTSVDLYSNKLPSEPLEVSSDEAPEYPESAYSFRSQLLLDAHESQLVLSQDALKFLATSLASGKDAESQGHSLLKELGHHKPIASRQITPPISPLVVPEELYVPGPDRSQIPIASDPSSLLEEDLKAAHSILVEASSPPILGTPDLPPESEFESFTPVARSTESLKVEQPLIPLTPSSPPIKHAVDFREAVEGVQLACDADYEVEGYAGKEIPELFSDELLEELQAVASTANMAVEQERLENADAIARVQVPVMDFAIPEPEWQGLGGDSNRQVKHILQCSPMTVTKWKDNHRDRDYWWVALPSRLRRVSLDESLDGDADLRAVDVLRMFNGSEAPTAASYVWKRPGLAILREPDDDEEEDIPIGDDGITHLPDIQTLSRKRKFDLDTLDHDSSPSNNTSILDLVRHSKQARSTDATKTTSLLVSNDDSNATSALLANYVNIRTSKRRKSEVSSFFGPEKSVQGDAIVVDQGNEKRAKDNEASKYDIAPIEKPKAAPVPGLPEYSDSIKLIVALTLSPGILNWIEKLLPGADLVERDFDYWNTVAWNRNMVSRSPIISPLAAEADVIVSPVTGIILTPLIKVIQKPLPGQKGKTAIRERVEKVSARYERLVILVSQANRVDESTRDLSASECTSFAEFSGFVLGLNPNSQVYLVGGGEETLAKWLVASIQRYSLEAAEVQSLLMVEETTWELTLRRAGMSAYAAQIILAELKATTHYGPEVQAMAELQRFILMPPHERIAQFSQLMGGTNVLRRVGAVLDGQWS
ncbi:hypothetical protein PG989_005371 [Apiospora arundinis]|uniref:Nucleoporin nup49 n=1 Tax=Apiospora arundinis TaxID=335852 RepID=A0ABR2IUG3_9PEZI